MCVVIYKIARKDLRTNRLNVTDACNLEESITRKFLDIDNVSF